MCGNSHPTPASPAPTCASPSRAAGCSGLTYDLDLVEGPGENDKVISGYGLELYIDKKSYIFLAGTVLDYSGGLNGKDSSSTTQRQNHLRLRHFVQRVSPCACAGPGLASSPARIDYVQPVPRALPYVPPDNARFQQSPAD